MRLSLFRWGAPAVLLAGSFAALGLFALPTSAQAAPAAPQLHVSGNKLVDPTGSQVVLHGVNRSGSEFACVQDNGISTVRSTRRRSTR